MGNQLSLCEQERAAVDHERLTGEVAATVTAEKQRDRTDVVFGITLTTDGMRLGELAVGLLVACRGLLATLRRRARRNRVDHDPVASPLPRRGASQRTDRLLGRVVRAVPGHAGDARSRPEV